MPQKQPDAKSAVSVEAAPGCARRDGIQYPKMLKRMLDMPVVRQRTTVVVFGQVADVKVTVPIIVVDERIHERNDGA